MFYDEAQKKSVLVQSFSNKLGKFQNAVVKATVASQLTKENAQS